MPKSTRKSHRSGSPSTSQQHPASSRLPHPFKRTSKSRRESHRSTTGHSTTRDEIPARNEGSTSPPTHGAIPHAGSRGRPPNSSFTIVPQRPTDITSFHNGSFSNAHDFVLNQPVFAEGSYAKEKDCTSLLAENTIPGAQFDSGERYPPPLCHPGTRLDIIEKVVSWVRDLVRKHKIMWLHGQAGVGKSAVVQTLAESDASSLDSVLGATIFFSKPNKRDDPQRVFTTIAYQLAVKYPEYRAYVVELLTVDPLLVKKSMVEQFKWLIVKPFAEKTLFDATHGTVLITLDGLDECNGESAQCEIIVLVVKFCLEHPGTPLAWIITSRPEPMICNAFCNVQGAYEEIDMPVDSDQACRDVERYLRDTFTTIKGKHLMSFTQTQQWPTEADFTKIASHSSGLFAFANTVARFTDDVEYANPVAQLQKVIDVLRCPLSPAAMDSPFAALDAVYTLILSSVLPRVWPTTHKLLFMMGEPALVDGCNILSINQADAYGALRKLHSILNIPGPEDADDRQVVVFHKSFDDYLRSQSRSGSFWLNPLEGKKLKLSASVRILLESYSATRPNVCLSNIHISWPHHLFVRHQIQEILFTWSLQVIYHHETRELDSLRDFVWDIDYGNFNDYLFEEDNIINAISTLVDTPCLKEWGVIKTVKIQSLDCDSLDLDEPLFCWEVSYQPHVSKQPAILKAVFPSGPADFRKSPSVGDGRLFCDDEVRSKIVGLPPSYPAVVLGRGDKILAR